MLAKQMFEELDCEYVEYPTATYIYFKTTENILCCYFFDKLNQKIEAYRVDHKEFNQWIIKPKILQAIHKLCEEIGMYE